MASPSLYARFTTDGYAATARPTTKNVALTCSRSSTPRIALVYGGFGPSS
jgi:hypothetical protein